MVYYNEIDEYTAAWLRKLIAAGLLPDGYVDTRSIWDIAPEDLHGYTQHHFFAGIGGWPYALQLAGWPADRPVWTGSCPCQPFSSAGKGAGFDDERHLWPAWHHLLRLYRPPVVFGEQVEAAINLGWLDLVQTDLEGEGYAFGAVGVPAAGVGAPHIRPRFWFVADTNRPRLSGRHSEVLPECAGSVVVGASRSLGESWSNVEWLECRDAKARPAEPGTCPLADGIPGRVGLLRGYGNAIVPQVAAEVIKAYMSVR